MPKKPGPKRRSECPLNASVEMLGDRWSLLIIRDMMLKGACTYKTFMECYEGIATNILADRLRKLVDYGIITTEPDPGDKRKVTYLLTEKGIDLAPVLTEMVALGSRARRYRQSGSSPAHAGRQKEISSRRAATLGAAQHTPKQRTPSLISPPPRAPFMRQHLTYCFALDMNVKSSQHSRRPPDDRFG